MTNVLAFARLSIVFWLIAGIALLYSRPCHADDDAIHKEILALQDKRNPNRDAIAIGLGREKVKAAIPALIEALDDDDRYLPANAACALGLMGVDAVEPLIKALADPRERVVCGAALALGEVGPKAKSAVPKLLGVLKSDKARVRIAVVLALGYIRDQASIKALAKCLQTDPDFGVRDAAGFAFGRLGADAKDAIPALIATIRDMNETETSKNPVIAPFTRTSGEQFMRPKCESARTVHDGAASALANMRAAPIALLIEALQDPQKELRRDALILLASPDAKDAVFSVIPFLRDKDPEMQALAVYTLGLIGPDAGAALPALRKLYDDPSLQMGMDAAEAVLLIKPPNEDAVKVLLGILSDPDPKTSPKIRTRVLEKIGSLKLRSDIVIAAVGAASSDNESSVRASAAFQLAQLASSFPQAMPHVVRCLEHENEAVRHSMVRSVEFYLKNEPRVVPGLMRNLNDPDAEARVLTAQALAQQGAAAASAIAALSKMAKDDKDADAREAAAAAVKKIQAAQEKAAQKK